MLKRIILRNVLIVAVILSVMFALCSCERSNTFSLSDFEVRENTLQRVYSFDSNDVSEPIQADKEKLQQLKDFLADSNVDYGYSELFNYEKALSGILVDHSVEKHKYTALDQNNLLTKESLFECVRRNNAEYLKSQTSLIEDIDDELLDRLCEIIVDATNKTLAKYTAINKERVYCNLGYLKIIENKASLDFASVGPEMVMSINRQTVKMVNGFTESNMYNVVLHEAMHILQYGCSCEKIEGCIRRCGLAHSYSDWEQDYSDWVWLAEGSAERMASLYANVEPMTYTTSVNYLLSMDLITVLREDVSANYVETICFYDDVNKLFSLFDADSENEKQEIYNMIYSLEIMQSEPDDVKEAYKKYYGSEWTEEIRAEINNKVKRPIVKTFTKIFYNNLIEVLNNNSISKNEILFLINLYESTINYHLRINNPEYDSYNADFNQWYGEVQKLFFDSLQNVSHEDYKNYEASDENKIINAGMKWLGKEKQDFLIEKFEDNLCDFKFV